MPNKANISAIIVAAGRGTRAGGPVPKQYQDLSGRTVLERSLTAFIPHAAQIIVVHSEADRDLIKGCDLPPGTELTLGGATREASVRAGLALLRADCTHVLIHDAARPLVSPDVIDGVIAALNDHEAAAPGLPVVDALWRSNGPYVQSTASREGLVRAQTPQGFSRDLILRAHASGAKADDDVELASNLGVQVQITKGSEQNFKITGPDDLARAHKALQQEVKPMDIRTGNGFDVHRFGDGDHVMLCGVSIPHDRGLQGHSDADVGLHTITDAIYGAIAQGDIGRHFPPSDPQWKGADSEIFLAHAAGLARDMGFEISNVDATLMCELPKIGPHAEAMIQRLAGILHLKQDRISVKATTTERLGFTGRGEGIACMATVTLIKRGTL